jgi:hypothetical protein
MRQLCALCLFACWLLTSQSAVSQDYPKGEIYGGYSYLSIDINDLGNRQSANGWEAAASGNFNRVFAVEVDVSGYYKNISGLSVSDYAYGGGPRLNLRPVFIHVLIGGDHLTGTFAGESASQDGLNAAFGGGIVIPIGSRFAFRGSADYVLTRHNILGGSAYTQNNVRAGVGIAYLFGARGSQDSSNGRATSVPRGTVPLTSIGVKVYGNLEVFDVAPGSPAEKSGISRGDILNRVDGNDIASIAQLEAALKVKQPKETVRIGYLVRGAWQTESILTLGGVK